MAIDTNTRIEQRDAEARQNLASKGFFGRTLGNAGLKLANGIDRLTGWSDSERMAFTSGTAKGVMRGAVLGLLVGVVAIASFPVITAAVMGNMVLFGGAALGAAGFGIYEGQKSLDSYLYGQKKRLSDSIAQRAGAVPKEKPPVKTPEEMEAKKEGNSPFFQDKVKKSRETAAGIRR